MGLEFTDAKDQRTDMAAKNTLHSNNKLRPVGWPAVYNEEITVPSMTGMMGWTWRR